MNVVIQKNGIDGQSPAMMPHFERAIYPWQWANYPPDRKDNQVTPWIEAFVSALNWIKKTKGN